MNQSKLHSPLIVIDPVQPKRNASAALKQDKFEEFVQAAKKFLKKPSKKFFEEKKTDYDALAKKGNLIKLDIMAKKGKEDIIGTKLLKAFEYFRSKFRAFDLVDNGWEWNKKTKAIFWFVIKNKKLSATEIRTGPPTSIKIAVKHFKKKHKKTFTKKGRIMTYAKRKYKTPAELVRFLTKKEHIKTRLKSCKLSG